MHRAAATGPEDGFFEVTDLVLNGVGGLSLSLRIVSDRDLILNDKPTCAP